MKTWHNHIDAELWMRLSLGDTKDGRRRHQRTSCWITSWAGRITQKVRLEEQQCSPGEGNFGQGQIVEKVMGILRIMCLLDHFPRIWKASSIQSNTQRFTGRWPSCITVKTNICFAQLFGVGVIVWQGTQITHNTPTWHLTAAEKNPVHISAEIWQCYKQLSVSHNRKDWAMLTTRDTNSLSWSKCLSFLLPHTCQA